MTTNQKKSDNPIAHLSDEDIGNVSAWYSNIKVTA